MQVTLSLCYKKKISIKMFWCKLFCEIEEAESYKEQKKKNYRLKFYMGKRPKKFFASPVASQ